MIITAVLQYNNKGTVGILLLHLSSDLQGRKCDLLFCQDELIPVYQVSDIRFINIKKDIVFKITLTKL